MQNFSTYTQFVRLPFQPLYHLLIFQCLNQNGSDPTLSNTTTDDGLYCPRVFDGFACWNETPANTTAVQPCPDIIIGFDSRRTATRQCTDNGTWYVNPETEESWSNYTDCVDVDDLKFRELVNNIYVHGYAVSTVAICISLSILLYLRNLNCKRIKIHRHLFIAFILNNVVWIFWYKTVVENVEVVQRNASWCQLMHVICIYFMMTSYMWMFFEGLHLYLSLALVFMEERLKFRWFIISGWIVPVFHVGIYAAVRALYFGSTERCWMDFDYSFLVITIPVSITLVASLGFLCNIIVILVKKLDQGRTITTAKAVRACFTLIPLFGIQYIMYPIRPERGTLFEAVYETSTAVLTSYQGLFVAVLYCFLNKDILDCLKAKFCPSCVRRIPEEIPMAAMTTGDGYATRDNAE